MSVSNAYMTLSGAVDADVLRDEPLSRRTSYRIGGPAALVVVAHSYGALQRTLEVLAQEGVEWVLLGKGSNVLVSDKGYDGCVVLLDGEFSRMTVCAEEATITAGGGAQLARVVNQAMKSGLSGLEFCVGIPGTLGGAVSMDAGTRREWIGPRVRDLVVLRPGEGMHRYAGGEIEWGYRRTSLPTSEIILEATLELEPGDPAVITRDMEERLRRRREAQPLSKPSCGSVFRNPPERSAGLLIQSCGLSGAEQGAAQISPEHANFIVNRGGATAADVVALIRRAHDAVLERHGVDLACEVKLLGF
ncbi:UDP-N-acetylmuramate dehydrogenase [Thermophilibacter provencensis]|uniref:UDP-N-acetylenolpyruvoylglucosamine reductase n=1 Tax=Thermophilibacter provencensis TaxID=1852386 RepID=A0ABT7V5W1_9ACTN|nr:UDP-N-acetylmuramate dehydrogenase [Thermophilibacter provencensis]MDM8271371.1 UDP-N-acetylmuramate dehydrogenase [Thermophilibacter provencensis]